MRVVTTSLAAGILSLILGLDGLAAQDQAREIIVSDEAQMCDAWAKQLEREYRFVHTYQAADVQKYSTTRYSDKVAEAFSEMIAKRNEDKNMAEEWAFQKKRAGKTCFQPSLRVQSNAAQPNEFDIPGRSLRDMSYFGPVRVSDQLQAGYLAAEDPELPMDCLTALHVFDASTELAGIDFWSQNAKVWRATSSPAACKKLPDEVAVATAGYIDRFGMVYPAGHGHGFDLPQSQYCESYAQIIAQIERTDEQDRWLRQRNLELILLADYRERKSWQFEHGFLTNIEFTTPVCGMLDRTGYFAHGPSIRAKSLAAVRAQRAAFQAEVKRSLAARRAWEAQERERFLQKYPNGYLSPSEIFKRTLENWDRAAESMLDCEARYGVGRCEYKQ